MGACGAGSRSHRGRRDRRVCGGALRWLHVWWCVNAAATLRMSTTAGLVMVTNGILCARRCCDAAPMLSACVHRP